MKLSIESRDFIVPFCHEKSEPLRLDSLPTKIPKVYDSKKHYHKLMEEFSEELRDLQRVLYADNRYALLLIFQGMDTAGKDGAIRHVMTGINPQGCQVHSFKQPSAEELAHDYLWRTTKRLPMRGHIGIFNRSYYEEVLIVKAVPGVLEGQSLPDECVGHDSFWSERYQDIMRHEDFLHRNGTRVLKFFLHLSKDEQRNRLLSRAEEADKNWKISPADLKSRAQWDDFQQVYAECLDQTSHPTAPWYSIPADNKRNARLIISHIVVEMLQSLPIEYPKPDQKQLAEVEKVHRILTKQGGG